MALFEAPLETRGLKPDLGTYDLYVKVDERGHTTAGEVGVSCELRPRRDLVGGQNERYESASQDCGWWSVRVDLLCGGLAGDLWPSPGRVFAVSPAHTFHTFAEAIDDAFAGGTAATCTSSSCRSSIRR